METRYPLNDREYKDYVGLSWGTLQALLNHWDTMTEKHKQGHIRDLKLYIETLVAENQRRVLKEE